MQFRVIVVTDPQTQPQTHKQTGPITIHCAAGSAQCKDCTTVPSEVLCVDQTLQDSRQIYKLGEGAANLPECAHNAPHIPKSTGTPNPLSSAPQYYFNHSH